MGGDNSVENLVDLTPEEHYVAHQLLVKMYPGNRKLVYAANYMTGNVGERNNKSYGWVRRKVSEAKKGQPAWNKGIAHLGTGKDHPLWGTKLTKEHIAKRTASRAGFKHTEETKKKMSESRTGRIAWNAGLTVTPHSDEAKEKMRERALNRKNVTCPHCEKSGDPGPMARYHFNNCKNKKVAI